MNFFKKSIFKMVLPMIVNFLVLEAEKMYEEAKVGNDKKAYVIKTTESFLIANGLAEYLDFEKLGLLIENKVLELINKNN